MFENIEAKNIDSALKRVSAVSRGLKPEARERFLAITNTFHADKRWELVCERWEHMLSTAQNDATEYHDSVMSLLAIMFCVGFDEGVNSLVEEIETSTGTPN